MTDTKVELSKETIYTRLLKECESLTSTREKYSFAYFIERRLGGADLTPEFLAHLLKLQDCNTYRREILDHLLPVLEQSLSWWERDVDYLYSILNPSFLNLGHWLPQWLKAKISYETKLQEVDVETLREVNALCSVRIREMESHSISTKQEAEKMAQELEAPFRQQVAEYQQLIQNLENKIMGVELQKQKLIMEIGQQFSKDKKAYENLSLVIEKHLDLKQVVVEVQTPAITSSASVAGWGKKLLQDLKSISLLPNVRTFKLKIRADAEKHEIYLQEV